MDNRLVVPGLVPHKLDMRVTKLEREMGDVRKLAADASTDVGDVQATLRAHVKSLEALRETQIEFGKELYEQRKELHEQGKRMDVGFAQTREGFAKVGVGMAQLKAMLEIAIDRPGDES